MAVNENESRAGFAGTHVLPSDSVLIVGAGPVGLMTASVLAHYGVKSVILERNNEPTS